MSDTRGTANLFGALQNFFRGVADDYLGHCDRMKEAGFPETYIEFVRGRATGIRDAALAISYYEQELRRIADANKPEDNSSSS